MTDIVDRLRDPQLHAEIKFMRAEAAAEIERLRLAFTELNAEVCQRLGKALGYPWFKDDQKNFPGATTENGVCTGEHVAESIAAEAARWIAKVEFERDMWRSENLKKQAACEMMGERMGALEVQRDRLRAGFLMAMQYDNKCDQTGQPCDASKLCACFLETETWCDAPKGNREP